LKSDAELHVKAAREKRLAALDEFEKGSGLKFKEGC